MTKAKAGKKPNSTVSKRLTRTDILDADDIKTERVDVPEWGGHVIVTTMSAYQRDKFEMAQAAGKITNIRATIASRTIIDDKGDFLFSPSDIEKLATKSAAAMGRVFNTAAKLNLFTDEDIEDLEKN